MDIYLRDNGQVPDQGPAIIGVSVGLMAFGLLLVVVRLGYRLNSTGVKADDVLILCAVLCSLGHSVDDCISVIQYGYGKHREDLTPAQALAGKTTGAALGFWISQLLYKLSLLCTKLSICFLYRRVFERANKAFTISLYTVMGLVGAYYVASILVTIFECTPVSKSWIKTQPGTCIDTTTFFYANAAFNIFTDVIIMALPIPVIYQLHLPVRQRLLLCCVFAVGLFATATSIIRIFTLTATKSSDTTWAVAGSTLWSSAEINVAIICACLPMLRPPLQALFPRLFRSLSSRNSKYAEVEYGNRSGLSSGDRASRRVSRLALSPGGSARGSRRTSRMFSPLSPLSPTTNAFGKGMEFALTPIGNKSTTDQSEQTAKVSEDEPWFLYHSEDQEGILKQTEFSIVTENLRDNDTSERSQDTEQDEPRHVPDDDGSSRNSRTPGLAL